MRRRLGCPASIGPRRLVATRPPPIRPSPTPRAAPELAPLLVRPTSPPSLTPLHLASRAHRPTRRLEGQAPHHAPPAPTGRLPPPPPPTGHHLHIWGYECTARVGPGGLACSTTAMPLRLGCGKSCESPVPRAGSCSPYARAGGATCAPTIGKACRCRCFEHHPCKMSRYPCSIQASPWTPRPCAMLVALQARTLRHPPRVAAAAAGRATQRGSKWEAAGAIG